MFAVAVEEPEIEPEPQIELKIHPSLLLKVCYFSFRILSLGNNLGQRIHEPIPKVFFDQLKQVLQVLFHMYVIYLLLYFCKKQSDWLKKL